MKRYLITILSLVLASNFAYADIFPSNALNVRTDLTGNASWTAFTPASGSIYTVLYESMNTDSIQQNGTLELKCDGVTSLKVNSFKNVPSIERFKMAKCSNSLIAQTINANSSDQTTVSLIYVPYDIASESIYSSGSLSVTNSMTGGDILIVVSLFVLIMFNLFGILRRHT